MVQIWPDDTSGDTASVVRIRPWTTQGWRPTSAAVQPMLMASSDSGMQAMSAHSSQRAFSRRLRMCRSTATRNTRMKNMPRAIMRW